MLCSNNVLLKYSLLSSNGVTVMSLSLLFRSLVETLLAVCVWFKGATSVGNVTGACVVDISFRIPVPFSPRFLPNNSLGETSVV